MPHKPINRRRVAARAGAQVPKRSAFWTRRVQALAQPGPARCRCMGEWYDITRLPDPERRWGCAGCGATGFGELIDVTRITDARRVMAPIRMSTSGAAAA